VLAGRRSDRIPTKRAAGVGKSTVMKFPGNQLETDESLQFLEKKRKGWDEEYHLVKRPRDSPRRRAKH
jgi:hypothetical protein